MSPGKDSTKLLVVEDNPRYARLIDDMLGAAFEATYADALDAAVAALDELEARAASLEVRPDIAGYDDLVHAFDLRAMLLSGRTTLLAALERRETRGAHNRSDFPDADGDGQRVNYVVDPELRVGARPVAQPPEDVVRLATGEVSVAGRLLE